MDRTRKFKVRISEEPRLGETLNSVEFTAMPRISEGRSASYDELQILHHPGGIQKYKSTSSRTWNIQGQFISRNIQEATQNLKYTNLIRSWVMPFYGVGTGGEKTTQQYLGAPPPVLTLTAYGDKMIGPVKCVLENYSWDWPNDVDYISTDEKYPFPVILGITLSLKESFSPAEYSGFNLVKYRNGELTEAFRATTATELSNERPKSNYAASAAYAAAASSNSARSQPQVAEPSLPFENRTPDYTNLSDILAP